MYFLYAGVLLLLLKTLEVAPVADWSWWWVLSPFLLAVVWWAWADSTGYTKKRRMDEENAKREARLEKNRQALGMINRKGKK